MRSRGGRIAGLEEEGNTADGLVNAGEVVGDPFRGKDVVPILTVSKIVR